MGVTGPKCNFFFKFATRSLAGGAHVQGGPVAPPSSDRGAHPQARQGVCHPPGDRGACRPPSGDRVLPPYISILPLFPHHLSPKIPPKIQKKERGEEKGSGEALPDCAFMICRLVHLAYVFFHWYCRVI